MTLKDRLARPPAGNRNGKPCSVAKLLETLPPSEVRALRAALDDTKGWPHAVLQAEIIDDGHYLGSDAVGKHRRGDCRCGKGRL